MIRLDKFLCEAGAGSRSEVKLLIKKGRVTINGTVAKAPETKVDEKNDQVALDMRLYVRERVLETDALLKDLMGTILTVMEENLDTYMPGFTHLQKAQPTTLAHYTGAYFEMFKRDRQRMKDIYRRMNFCPLGSGALAGTTYPLDRAYTAELLGFEGPTLNSMDSVSDRDYVIEYLSALSMVMMHLSRFSEEIILWNSNEYRFVEIDGARKDRAGIRRAHEPSDDDEGAAPCL